MLSYAPLYQVTGSTGWLFMMAKAATFVLTDVKLYCIGFPMGPVVPCCNVVHLQMCCTAVSVP